MMHLDDTALCFSRHMGLWCIEPLWLAQALQAVQRGLWPLQAVEPLTRSTGALYAQSANGVAVIRIQDQIQKGQSKFGGTSTIVTKIALRQAVAADDIKSVLLAVYSPGGQVDGVSDLADEILKTRQSKPVSAYIEDLGASAAYWIASQAQRITANRTAHIGSIGVFAVLTDLSGLAEREGVSVRLISTGPYKGLGAPGTPVTPALVDEVQSHVDAIGAFFFQAVQQGRKLSSSRLAAVTDGRLWLASEAQQLGLIDGIESFDEALAAAALLRPVRRAAVHRAQALRSAWEDIVEEPVAS